MTTKRTDIHAPSTFDPAKYQYQFPIYVGPRGGHYGVPIMSDYEIEQRKLISAHSAHGNFANKGTCDHCGASFYYGDVFRHVDTQEMVVVGHICADKSFSYDSRREYEYNKLKSQIAAFRERAKMKTAVESFFASHPGLREALEFDHEISRDMLKKLIKWGSLSDKQVAFALRIPQIEAEKKARLEQQAAEKAAAPDWQVNGERLRVEGEILGGKWVPGYAWGSPDSLKVIVKLADGRKCYGSMPIAIINKFPNDTLNALKGKTFSFEAQFEVSKDDKKFAFFKRPTKSEVR